MKLLLKCVILVSLIVALASQLGRPAPTPKSAKNSTTTVKQTAQSKPITKATPAPAKPKPKTAAKATPKAPTYAYAPVGWARYVPLIKQYNWPVPTAIAIMRAESGGDPNQISDPSINWDHIPDYGLMQLHGIDILDPAQNIAYAYYHKYLPAHGFTPWTTYTSGRYLQYLP